MTQFKVIFVTVLRYALSVAEDPSFAALLWRRLCENPGVATALDRFAKRDATGPPLGLNHRIRVLRYAAPTRGGVEPPDEFQAHYDQVCGI